MRSLYAALLALTVLFALAAPGRADPSDADKQAFRAIISGQIQALQRDDGAGAYDYAAPPIRHLYPTPESFMDMVRRGFQPVYRPQDVTFGVALDSPLGPKQRVFVTGPDGRKWIAEYTFQKQPDGIWKINGCKLLEDDGATI